MGQPEVRGQRTPTQTHALYSTGQNTRTFSGKPLCVPWRKCCGPSVTLLKGRRTLRSVTCPALWRQTDAQPLVLVGAGGCG